ncbi:AsmA family protein [Microbacteriaceae bacterium K1510]|nr:AsmA family protein [Microbacteriaceae bacterium K1510]
MTVQTTLLGLAIALILALVAALVGPLLVDWGTYRALFEREATQLVGVPVKVQGSIDARLLPSPQLTLYDIQIGEGARAVRARSLGIEFALGPLMRGEWRASEMHLAGPQASLGVDASGQVQAPSLAVSFDPDALSIERLSIEDGKVTLTDAANGGNLVLDKVWFNGEARSLVGPFKGEGAVRMDGELYPYRLSTARYSDENGLKLRLNVDPVARPLAIEVDGALALAGDMPRFEGNLAVSRPVGIARGAQVTQPWKISGKLKASAQSALLQNLEYQYGSEEQGVKLTGVADFKFGKRPRLDGVLSSRQVDLDRALGGRDGKSTPAAALRQLAGLGGAVFQPNVPVQIGIGIDQLTLSGGTVQNLRGDLSRRDGGWALDRFEFRAPGFAQVRVSGQLAVDNDNIAFSGPAEIDAGDPKALTAWLEGRGDTGQGDLRPLNLRGDITLGTERIAVERLKAEFERKTISGRLAYVFANAKQPAKLDAELNAPELDIDGAIAFGKALLAGSKLERPHAMSIAADIGRATVSGFTGRDASARVKIDGDGIEIDKLSVADLGGAAFSANGRIVTSGTPQGSVRVDLDAPDVKPVLALLARFAPDTAQVLERRAAAMAPAKLRGQFSLQGAASATQGKIELDGNIGKVRLALNGQGKVDATAFTARDMQIDGKLSADDGKLLTAMLGLDGAFAVTPGPGVLTLNARGPAQGDLRVETKLTAGGLDGSATGTVKPFAAEPAADLRLTLSRADASPLRGAKSAPLPVTYAGRLQLAGKTLTLTDINAGVAGANVRGHLVVALTDPRRVQGELDADAVDGAALIAAGIGMPAAPPAKDAGWTWSSEPFEDATVATGKVALKARQVTLLPRITAREFRATLAFDKDKIAVDEITGTVAGGKLTGRIAFQDSTDGLKMQIKAALANADAAALLTSGPRPAVSGTLSLSTEMEGSGLSPVALIGSLQGSGTIDIANAQFAGIDARAFDVVARAVDQGLPIDNTRIADLARRALESGQLPVKQAQGTLAVAAGQVRLNTVSLESKDATLALSGNLDLIDGSLDARLVLSGMNEVAGARPDIFMALGGAMAAPTRTIDVSALTGWLTLRSVENQAKRLRAIEQTAPKIESATPAPGTAAPLSPPPLPPATPTAMPTVEPTTSSVRHNERAPALPPPLDVRPYPGPPRSVRPDVSVGAQN